MHLAWVASCYRTIQIRRKDFSFRSISFVSLDFNVPQWVRVNFKKVSIMELKFQVYLLLHPSTFSDLLRTAIMKILMVNNDYMYIHDDFLLFHHLLGELMMNDKSLKKFWWDFLTRLLEQTALRGLNSPASFWLLS